MWGWAWVGFVWKIDSDIYVTVDLLKKKIEISDPWLSNLTVSWYMEGEIDVPECVLETLEVKLDLDISKDKDNLIKKLKDEICKEIIADKDWNFDCSNLEELRLEIEITSTGENNIDDMLWGGYIRGEMKEWIEIAGDTETLYINDLYIVYKTKDMDEERKFYISLNENEKIANLLENLWVIKFDSSLELPEGIGMYITLNKNFVEWYKAIFEQITNVDDIDLLIEENNDWCN